MAQPPELEDAPPVAADVAAGPDSQSELDDLVAKATAKYAVKDYSAAAELYSRATELQAELNGEMSTMNADLLYLYGRCLYHVAVQNSDVLGAKVAGEDKKKRKEKAAEDKLKKPKKPDLDKVTEEEEAEADGGVKEDIKEDGDPEDGAAVAATNSEEGESTEGKDAKGGDQTKPYFNITGDENWDDSEDEDGAGDGEAEAEEDPEDDFSNAFEVLDIARVLLEKRLQELTDAIAGQEADGKAEAMGRSILDRKKQGERLADTRDLQAEISLEGERFADAATDLKEALDMKLELYPEESSVVAEAHYKLSLALEFASITPATDAQGNPQPGTVGKVDQKGRDEAAYHMEKAIKSCEKRIAIEEESLKSGAASEAPEAAGQDAEKKPKVTRQSIDDVKDMVGDMQQRLKELREPPVSINDAASRPGPAELTGILGSLIGESPEAQKVKLEEAVSKANDLSGLVKKKKPAAGEKRKAEDESAEGQTAGKKPKQ